MSFLTPALYFLITTFASTVGAMSGIGGGVIIKPLFDSLGTMGVSTISFLSGCTVLAMSSVSLLRSAGKGGGLRGGASLPLAIGASLGGVAGKALFQCARLLLGKESMVGLVQAILLLAINVGVFLYMLYKSRIRSLRVRGSLPSLALGAGLGILSSFLGIGGGPVNIAVLYYFYSMSPRETTINSLFIIFCSQLASLAASISTGTVPAFDFPVLAVMCSGGVVGALLGRRISRLFSDSATERFFACVLVLLVGINIYNIARFALA